VRRSHKGTTAMTFVDGVNETQREREGIRPKTKQQKQKTQNKKKKKPTPQKPKKKKKQNTGGGGGGGGGGSLIKKVLRAWIKKNLAKPLVTKSGHEGVRGGFL